MASSGAPCRKNVRFVCSAKSRMTRFSRFFGQAHRLRFVDPLCEADHGHGAPVSAAFLVKVVLPVLAEHEMGRVGPHLAQEQRVGDVPQQRTQRLCRPRPDRPLIRAAARTTLIDLLQIARA